MTYTLIFYHATVERRRVETHDLAGLDVAIALGLAIIKGTA